MFPSQIAAGPGEGDKIFVERQEVVSEIVNMTTIRHLFTPDTFGVYNVDCIRDKKLIKKKEAWQDLESSGSSAGQSTELVLEGNSATIKIGFCTQRICVGCKSFATCPFDPT